MVLASTSSTLLHLRFELCTQHEVTQRPLDIDVRSCSFFVLCCAQNQEHVVPLITRHWRATLHDTGKKCHASAASYPLKLGWEDNTSARENVDSDDEDFGKRIAQNARVSVCKAGLCSQTRMDS